MSSPGAGIADLNRWTEKTAQAVREICREEQTPCVGFSLVFHDPLEPDEAKQWKYVTKLGYNPSSIPVESLRKALADTFDFIAEGIKRILAGRLGKFTDADDLEYYTREVKFH